MSTQMVSCQRQSLSNVADSIVIEFKFEISIRTKRGIFKSVSLFSAMAALAVAVVAVIGHKRFIVDIVHNK